MTAVSYCLMHYLRRIDVVSCFVAVEMTVSCCWCLWMSLSSVEGVI